MTAEWRKNRSMRCFLGVVVFFVVGGNKVNKANACLSKRKETPTVIRAVHVLKKACCRRRARFVSMLRSNLRWSLLLLSPTIFLSILAQWIGIQIKLKIPVIRRYKLYIIITLFSLRLLETNATSLHEYVYKRVSKLVRFFCTISFTVKNIKHFWLSGILSLLNQPTSQSLTSVKLF